MITLSNQSSGDGSESKVEWVMVYYNWSQGECKVVWLVWKLWQAILISPLEHDTEVFSNESHKVAYLYAVSLLPD